MSDNTCHKHGKLDCDHCRKVLRPRRDWRRDNMRLKGPYGIPAEFLTDAEKAQIDAGFAQR